jgi:hypothetical protein
LRLTDAANIPARIANVAQSTSITILPAAD